MSDLVPKTCIPYPLIFKLLLVTLILLPSTFIPTPIQLLIVLLLTVEFFPTEIAAAVLSSLPTLKLQS